MKKLLALAVCMLTIGAAQAQQPTPPDGRNSYSGKILDTTVTGAATPAAIFPVIGAKSALGVHYQVTKTSGTVAGTIKFQASANNGTSWATFQTYTLQDATQDTVVHVISPAFTKYRVLVTQTNGTVNANYKVWATYRQEL